ncbi:MAG: Rpn family recombination-promoting nuclease/putative transposase [Treponema sp.]|nr:Rpn family recombination-promoting nuclease/putative transposase [Treponema sp.]
MKVKHFKTVDELTFSDDYMFGEVMKDPDICAHVIEVLLKIKVEKIEYPERQKIFKESYDSKGVRFDVYVKDSDRIFDIEIQCRTVSNLPKRTRYYQSMIDMDNLLKGETYDSLPESFIIFICKKDPFTLNLPQYTFQNRCIEDNSLFLNDKTTKVFYNASSYGGAEDRELRAFLKFVAENQAEDDFTRKLESHILQTIRSETFRREYMEMTLREHDLLYWGKQEGLEEGASQKAVEAAENFLRMNVLSFEQVSQGTGLPLQQVKEIAERLSVTRKTGNFGLS